MGTSTSSAWGVRAPRYAAGTATAHLPRRACGRCRSRPRASRWATSTATARRSSSRPSRRAGRWPGCTARSGAGTRGSALGLAAALSCVDADTVHEGENVTLFIDPEVEACGDMVGHMDRFVAATADYLGVSLAGQRFYFVWYLRERFAAEARCSRWRDGCPPATIRVTTASPARRCLHPVPDRSPRARCVPRILCQRRARGPGAGDRGGPRRASVRALSFLGALASGKTDPLSGQRSKFSD